MGKRGRPPKNQPTETEAVLPPIDDAIRDAGIVSPIPDPEPKPEPKLTVRRQPDGTMVLRTSMALGHGTRQRGTVMGRVKKIFDGDYFQLWNMEAGKGITDLELLNLERNRHLVQVIGIDAE